jgi:dTDP-4-amino-4,6-dideoxygalactose transaminase
MTPTTEPIYPQKIVFSEADRAEIIQRIDFSLSTGQVAMGQNVQEFEANFAQFFGTKHAIAVNSGGAAIAIAMHLLNVEDKEVLVPTNTFVATASEVLLAGGSVRLVDTDPKTFSVSLNALKAAVTPQTVGVNIVHIGGIITPEIEAIRDWCQAQGLWLFEDAAHAHGSSFNGKSAGKFGCMAAYSFYATKVMTSGEGGMLVTDDDDLAAKAKGLRDYGKPQPWVSYYTQLGSNWRMSEFCAAVGLVQLKRLPKFIEWREKIANFYTQNLQNSSQITLVLPSEKSSWYKYIVLLPPGVNREQIKAKMKEKGVSLPGGVYETPLHQQPIFQEISDQFPLADDVCQRHICLPIYFGLTEEQAAYIVECLRLVLSEIM